MINLMQGDCLEVMKDIPDGSVDMVLCDLPYGSTWRNDWDTKIAFGPLWEQYKRIIKRNGAICLFAQMPFGAELIMSNKKMYRYEWVYEKPNATGFLDANRKPLRAHEIIAVFYQKLPTYHPQFSQGKPYKAGKRKCSTNYNFYKAETESENPDGKRYPRDIIKFAAERGLHPTQKPVPLLEYLIRTYTDEGETVLDNCMGSGSTGVACVNTGRNFIGIELDKDYFKVAKDRIEKTAAEADSAD